MWCGGRLSYCCGGGLQYTSLVEGYPSGMTEDIPTSMVEGNAGSVVEDYPSGMVKDSHRSLAEEYTVLVRWRTSLLMWRRHILVMSWTTIQVVCWRTSVKGQSYCVVDNYPSS